MVAPFLFEISLVKLVVSTDARSVFSGTSPIPHTANPNFIPMLQFSEQKVEKEKVASTGARDPPPHRGRRHCDTLGGPDSSLETNRPDVCHPQIQLLRKEGM